MEYGVQDELPVVSVVTPVLNAAAYIEDALRSVLSQGYPRLEYIVVDGGSTDGTREIIRAYEDQLTCWISEKDEGMYDALNKGFALSSGEVMGWISGTDLLHPGALRAAGSVFASFPDVEWITGVPTNVDDAGVVMVHRQARWSRIRFLAGANRYIQQESTFWRRSLWDRAGGYVDASRRLSSDFELWVRFFRFARLYTVDTLIGAYRYHGDSLGRIELEECTRIQNELVEAELDRVRIAPLLRAFRRIDRQVERVAWVHRWWARTVIRALHDLPAPDLAPVIHYRRGSWWRKTPRMSVLGKKADL